MGWRRGSFTTHPAGACGLAGCVHNRAACSSERMNLGLTHTQWDKAFRKEDETAFSTRPEPSGQEAAAVGGASPRSPRAGEPTAPEQSPPGSVLCCQQAHTPPRGGRPGWDGPRACSSSIRTADADSRPGHPLTRQQATEEPPTRRDSSRRGSGGKDSVLEGQTLT